MSTGPNITRIAAAIGDPARAEMLCALMAGRALTATELAGHAGITKQTGSTHLRRLLDARLVAVQAQGRHRRNHLAGALGAALLKRVVDRGWAKREHGSRLVTFRPSGERALQQALGGSR